MILIYIFAFGYVTWLFYLAGMSILPAWQSGELSKLSEALSVPVLITFLVLDYALNIIMIVPFGDFRQEKLLTGRLNRYLKNEPLSRRGKAAAWVCDHWLNPFVKGNHCIK